MNTTNLRKYIFEKFPTDFENIFERVNLKTILAHSEDIKDSNEQAIYLTEMIPQIQESEVRQFIK